MSGRQSAAAAEQAQRQGKQGGLQIHGDLTDVAWAMLHGWLRWIAVPAQHRVADLLNPVI